MKRIVAAVSLAVLAGAIGEAWAQDPPPPNSTDRAFAVQLWQAMTWARMVGDGATRSAPFKGGPTHTEVLEYLEQTVRVGYVEGLSVVKKNYTDQNDKKVRVANVWRDPKTYMMSITVMFRRRGYDPKNNDWFWAEYEPNGTVTYAGKVKHCIVCHQPGKDYRFLPLPE